MSLTPCEGNFYEKFQCHVGFHIPKLQNHTATLVQHIYQINHIQYRPAAAEFLGLSLRPSQGWGQFRNWNWNWCQFQFQFQELELQRNWIKGIGIGIDKEELKELIQFLFLIVNSFWFFCYVFQDFIWITSLVWSQTLLNTIDKNIIR